MNFHIKINQNITNQSSLGIRESEGDGTVRKISLI